MSETVSCLSRRAATDADRAQRPRLGAPGCTFAHVGAPTQEPAVPARRTSHNFMRSVALLLAAVGLSEAALEPLSGPGLTRGWDADLMLPLTALGTTYVMGGDSLKTAHGARVSPQCIGEVAPGPDFSKPVRFDVDAETGFPQRIFPLAGESTVPAGALALPTTEASSPSATVLLFMMNVHEWNNGVAGNVSASGLLIRGTAYRNLSSFPIWEQTALWKGEVDGPLVNGAPVLSSDGFVYVYWSSRYRASAIGLARANATSLGIGDASFEYYLGVDESGAARWGSSGNEIPAAIPLGADDPAYNRVGELGALYEPESKCFVLCFYNYSIGHPLPGYYCATSREPGGGWSPPQLIFNGSEPWCVGVG